jgi:hypothetical protein
MTGGDINEREFHDTVVLYAVRIRRRMGDLWGESQHRVAVAGSFRNGSPQTRRLSTRGLPAILSPDSAAPDSGISFA